MKKFLSLLFLSIIVLSTAYATNDVSVSLNGTIVSFSDAKPYIDNNQRALIPVRAVSELLGYEVSWNPSTKIVTVIDDGRTIQLTVGQKQAKVDGSPITMDTEATITQSTGRTYVPLRFIMEAFNAEVKWVPETHTVEITTPDTVLYVNSKLVPSANGAPFVEENLTYVPLQPVIEGMGDHYEYNEQSSTVIVTKKDSTVVNFFLHKNTITVNGTVQPLTVREVNGTNVPGNFKPFLEVNALKKLNIISVPAYTIETYLGYPVVVDKSNGLKVSIGTSTTPPIVPPVVVPPVVTPVPETYTIETAPSMATAPVALTKWVGCYLGISNDEYGSYYSPITGGPNSAVYRFNATSNECYITMKRWSPTTITVGSERVKPDMKIISQVMFPKHSTALYDFIDGVMNDRIPWNESGKNIFGGTYHVAKTTIDGWNVHLNYLEGQGIDIFIKK